MRGSSYKISSCIDVNFKKKVIRLHFLHRHACINTYLIFLLDFALILIQYIKTSNYLSIVRTEMQSCYIFFVSASKHLFASAFDSLNF